MWQGDEDVVNSKFKSNGTEKRLNIPKRKKKEKRKKKKNTCC